MKRSIIISLTVLSVIPLCVSRRTGEEIRQIAKDRLVMMSDARKTDLMPLTRVARMEMLSVYESEGTGYVVVSHSGETPSVLGYSDRHFDPEQMPDGLKWWLDQTNRYLMEGEMALAAEAPQSPVEPMLTTRWAQESPFNKLCPQTGGFWGTSPQTGCVATAMAQAMKYFEYPAASTGSGTYSADGGNSYKTVSMNTTFKWDKMRDSYRMGYSEDEATAVAELMRDCGYASNMIYSEQGSGALLYEGANGLVKNMQYDPYSMKMMTRTYYRDDEWMAAITKEMEAKRPVIYMAVDPEKLGHAFVLDGMDAEGRVHINWGWSGDANGYYDISIPKGLNPSYPNPYTGQDIKYTFTDEHAMIIGLNPSATPAEGTHYESFFAGYDYPTMHFDDDTLYIESVPVFNFSHLDFQGLLGLVIQGEDGHAVVLPFFYSGWEDDKVIPVLGGMMITEEYYPQGTLNETDGQTPRPDGKYRMYFVSWAKEEMEAGTNPQPIRYPVALAKEGEANYAVWEAEIKNGHWDENSLRMVSGTAGVEAIEGLQADDDAPATTYTLDGKILGESAAMPAGTPVIVRKGSSVKKIINK